MKDSMKPNFIVLNEPRRCVVHMLIALNLLNRQDELYLTGFGQPNPVLVLYK